MIRGKENMTVCSHLHNKSCENTKANLEYETRKKERKEKEKSMRTGIESGTAG